MTMWTDAETMISLSNTCWLLLMLPVKIAVRMTNFQSMRETVSVNEAVVSDSEVHKADEVSVVRLVGEIDDELDH